MNVDFTDIPGHFLLERSLSAFPGWQSLKRLTLVARSVSNDDPAILGHNGLQEILKIRQDPPSLAAIVAVLSEQTIYHEVLGILESCGRDLTHLEREVIIDLGATEFNEKGRPSRSIKKLGDPNQVLAEINDSFGGRLIVDGKVYREDGNLAHDIFVLSPISRSGKDFYYEKDLTVWHLAILIGHNFRSLANYNEIHDIFYFILSNIDAFAIDAVRSLLVNHPIPTSKDSVQTMIDRTDLWDAIKDRDIPRFLGSLQT